MGLSRMTFVVEGDEYTVDQATKQLDKLIDIVKVADITGADMVARELALIKVATTLETRSQIIEIVQLFRAKIVDVGSQSVVVETTGEEVKINALIELLEPFGITELMRTGRVAMVRGKSTGEISDNFSTNYFGANQDRAIAREVGSY
jgi:acetolactate synthase-1/3 small subunit